MIKSLIEFLISKPDFKGKYRVVRYLMFFQKNRPVRCKFGVLMLCQPMDLTNFFCLTGQQGMGYEDVYKCVTDLQPGMAFIDIGANAGLFSLVAAERLKGSGPVISVEPSLSTFTTLLANIGLNQSPDVFPFRLALSHETAVASFEEGTANHSGVAHLSATGTGKVLCVQGQQFLKIIAPLLDQRDIMIKIDVEGAEALIVTAIADFVGTPWVKTVIVEIDNDYLARFGTSSSDIYAVMKHAGLEPKIGKHEGHYNEIFERISST